MQEPATSWQEKLSEIEELARRAEALHLPIAVDGNASSATILRNAETTARLVKLLQRLHNPSEGDRKILLTKADKLRALMDAHPG